MAKKSTKKASKKTTTKPAKVEPKKYAGPILVLKTTKDGGVPHWDGSSDGNGGKNTTAFRWPRSGIVEAPDWDPEPKCGGGLHGLEFGEGSWNLLSENETGADEWRVIRVQPGDFVRLTDGGNVKVKLHRGEVVYCGNKAEALARVMCGKEALEKAQFEAQNYSSTAASSGYSSTAASSGNSSTAASSGNSSTAASSGNYSKAASSGDSSTAASSGYYSKAEQKGKSGIATAIGDQVQGKAGENGLLILTWWDEPAKRSHACVGEVGIDGIEADTWYKVVDGKLVKA